jgi:hypothetical protein
MCVGPEIEGEVIISPYNIVDLFKFDFKFISLIFPFLKLMHVKEVQKVSVATRV